ncbi:MAG: DNA topoisomerase IV subunit A [Mycoplasmatota bacterium]
MQEVIKKIHDYSLEEIMGERYGRYAKTIIQDRAIPDARDGLKPVQRRILYAMYLEKNTYDKGYRKSAKTVGNVIGNYHPHGDSSIYEAMVRMSQSWKQNMALVDMHGNNGSMDGDSPAAMRYTEARLSKISNELLKDIKKDTVIWAPNFDDTDYEPTVLPAKYPNLLVNGSTGISAGYATNIPPHNLEEIINATIKRIDSPNCRLDTLLEIVKGPDFPTGGIVEGKQGIIDAFTCGRGKVIVRSKYEFAKEKTKEQIVVTEIPFELNKASLVKKIDDIRIDKKIEGISEVRDESDRNGLRIVIDLKKDSNKELILNYLLKNTDLQTTYNYNMVSIVNRVPKTLGLIELLDAYINHQKEVIIKRTNFDLAFAKKRFHIVNGLIKAVSIIDEVIATIRKSNNKNDAKINLIKNFSFTDEQAEAILILQLYRLTNFDIVTLEEEASNLEKTIALLEAILSDEDKLKSVMKKELKNIRDEYKQDRKTLISDTITEIKIDSTHLINKEDVIVVVTKEGYIKRVSLRSYNKDEDTTLKEEDYLIGLYEMNTLDNLLLFTNKGNYLQIPVHEIPDLKWKELGKHVSNVVKLSADEQILSSLPVYDFDTEKYVTTFTKNGMVKRSLLKDYKLLRYSKPVTNMKLKENDEVISISYNNYDQTLVVTKNGFGLLFDTIDIPITGVKSGGVKAINLKNDEVVSGLIINEGFNYITLFTEKNTGKRVKISQLDKGNRARKGSLLIRDVKTNPYYLTNCFVVNSKTSIGLLTNEEITYIKITELPINDKLQTGSQITKQIIKSIFIKTVLENKNTKEEIIIEKPTIEQIDEQILTIDDFLDDFKIE